MADSIVDKWVNGLPGGVATTIISLLGRKSDGLSEFSFYTFSVVIETTHESGKRPLFQDWLAQRPADRAVQPVEDPSTDFKPLETVVLEAAAQDVEACLLSGRIVVLVDSCGLPLILPTHLKRTILGEEVCHGTTEKVQPGI